MYVVPGTLCTCVVMLAFFAVERDGRKPEENEKQHSLLAGQWPGRATRSSTPTLIALALDVYAPRSV